MTAGQSSFPVARSIFRFEKFGQGGVELNAELLPHLGEVADEIAVIRSMHTEAINHDPAITFFQTGFQIAGRPSIGAWLSYGLGSENQALQALTLCLASFFAGRLSTNESRYKRPVALAGSEFSQKIFGLGIECDRRGNGIRLATARRRDRELIAALGQ
jgi:hypothetical protein